MGRARGGAALLIVAVGLVIGGCSGAANNRFITRTGSGPIEIAEPGALNAVRAARSVAAVSAPPRTPAAALPTAETIQPELRASLVALRASPSAAAHLRVGLAYQRVLVLDLAIEHFDDALRTNPRMAAAYDARARVWRDWGMLGPAMGDATRAVFFAPGSAAARNTLGTILAGVGDRASAAAAYRCAAQLDPAATWARANLSQLADTTPTTHTDCAMTKTPRS